MIYILMKNTDPVLLEKKNQIYIWMNNTDQIFVKKFQIYILTKKYRFGFVKEKKKKIDLYFNEKYRSGFVKERNSDMYFNEK